MAQRDDDPVHPNYDGIRFQATTDKLGVIAVPISAQTVPPVSFMRVVDAVDVHAQLQALINVVRALDPASYFADFLDDAREDLADAITTCSL
jgi:hypothetical protein